MIRSEHPVLRRLRRNWLVDAEWSASPHQPTKHGLSLYFTDPFEWEAFLELGYVDEAGQQLVRDMRGRFELVPRVWVKLHLRGGEVEGLSHYFVVNPQLPYPITTLRLGLRILGLKDASRLEAGLLPALESPETLWAMIAKGERPRVSCRVRRSLLPALDSSLETSGLGKDVEWMVAIDASIEAGDFAYVSIDLDSGEAALDYEEVVRPPVEVKTIWGAGNERRYLKVRPGPSFSVYRPLARLLQLTEERGDVREAAKRYYDAEAATIHGSVGEVYQAGFVPGLIGRIGVQPNETVLDAGAGVGGPAAEIAASAEGVRVLAVTVSAQQATIATKRASVQMLVGDYHRLPVADASIDRVVFLESLGYARDTQVPLREAMRVLKPGGAVYVKDVFVQDGELTPEQRLDLSEFDEVYAQRTPTHAETRDALVGAGFVEVEETRIDDLVNMESFYGAMFTDGALNEFGRRHYRRFSQLPVQFWEFRGRKAP